MKRKGQVIVFEQVMLFAISVTLFLVSISVFSVYQNYYLDVGTENQLDEVKEWVASSILRVAINDQAESTVIIHIPREIGGAVYSVQLTEDQLVIRNLLTDQITTAYLYGLSESYQFDTQSNPVTSNKGKLTIVKKLPIPPESKGTIAII